MRIFCAVRHSVNPSLFYGGLWSANFYPALRQLGHEIIESQTDLFPTSRFMDVPGDFTREEAEVRARTTERILDEVRIAHHRSPLDLFLCYFYNSHFDPAGFDDLRRLGVLSVNFYCNSIHQFELVKVAAAKSDFAWHSEKNARQRYLDAGANPVWVQMGANPDVYHPIHGVQRLPTACFLGQRYADRDRWMVALVRSGVPIAIYGHGWKLDTDALQLLRPDNQEAKGPYLGRERRPPGSWRSYLDAMGENVRSGGFISGILRSSRQATYRKKTRDLLPLLVGSVRGPAKDVTAVFAEHDICLNFSNVWSDGRPGSRLVPHIRLRDFEAPMCRTCYLTGHSDEITEFYDVGREVETYRSPEELVDKIRFYLQHTEAAENLREAGYRRALRDHTWKRRFEELFGKIGLPRRPLTSTRQAAALSGSVGNARS
jgi:spore maturation protein CgeB